MKTKIALAILLVLSIVGNVYQFTLYQKSSKTITTLENDISVLTAEIVELKETVKTIEVLQTEIATLKEDNKKLVDKNTELLRLAEKASEPSTTSTPQ